MAKNKTAKDYYALKLGLFFGVIAALILISLTSFWLQRTIFDTEKFTSVTTQAFSEESSRLSIGELVADRVFEDKPILKALLSDRLSGHVAGLLGTESAQSSVTRLARESQLLVTSPRRDPVVIDLSGIKSGIVTVQELTGRTDNNVRLDADSIPDKVTVVDTAELPNVHHLAILAVWLGPLALIVALALVVWWIRRGGKAVRVSRTQIVLIVVALSAVLAIVIGPLVEPSFVSIGKSAPSQTLLRNLYEAFMTPFYSQAAGLGAVAAASLLVLTLWHEFAKRYAVKVTVTKRRQ